MTAHISCSYKSFGHDHELSEEKISQPETRIAHSDHVFLSEKTARANQLYIFRQYTLYVHVRILCL